MKEQDKLWLEECMAKDREMDMKERQAAYDKRKEFREGILKQVSLPFTYIIYRFLLLRDSSTQRFVTAFLSVYCVLLYLHKLYEKRFLNSNKL